MNILSRAVNICEKCGNVFQNYKTKPLCQYCFDNKKEKMLKEDINLLITKQSVADKIISLFEDFGFYTNYLNYDKEAIKRKIMDIIIKECYFNNHNIKPNKNAKVPEYDKLSEGCDPNL